MSHLCKHLQYHCQESFLHEFSMILVEATQRLEASGESSGDVEDDFPITSTGESGPWLLISIGLQEQNLIFSETSFN